MELWPLLVPSTCESCTGARRRLRPLGRLRRLGVGCAGRGEAGRGCGGRGRARACQRVPSFIYDVKSMSLSAGLLGGWLCLRVGPRGRPPPPGPPSPLRVVLIIYFLRFILGTCPLGCAYCLSPLISVTHFPQSLFIFFFIFV